MLKPTLQPQAFRYAPFGVFGQPWFWSKECALQVYFLHASHLVVADSLQISQRSMSVGRLRKFGEETRCDLVPPSSWP